MNSSNEKAEIEKILSSYNKALNASDVPKALALYAEDGVIMPNGAPLSKGQENLKTAYENLYKAFELNVEYFIDEVSVSENLAYARTHSIVQTLIRATGETMPVDNKELFTLYKNNGDWKIAHYIFNANKMK